MNVAIVAPTDAQLSYIASLARLNGYPPPVVYSKHEASEIITALRTGTYQPEDFGVDADLPWALRP